MKKYIFKSGDEFIKLKIDRKNKKIEIATSTTNYRFIPQPYWKLFGKSVKTLTGIKPPSKEDSLREMKEMELLNDLDFEKRLIKDFVDIGYQLIRKWS